jgi:hypothetical protein
VGGVVEHALGSMKSLDCRLRTTAGLSSVKAAAGLPQSKVRASRNTVLLAGGLEGVFHEHGDGHGADAAGDGGDCAAFGGYVGVMPVSKMVHPITEKNPGAKKSLSVYAISCMEAGLLSRTLLRAPQEAWSRLLSLQFRKGILLLPPQRGKSSKSMRSTSAQRSKRHRQKRSYRYYEVGIRF